ncbi:DMT family transporter [Pseudoalteromonas sp. S16_S37]|uniref:DMT family transporter n=1 Tax=Pseudoalteromonas sp. S16_S37 TaxID=2720228 RepID=UPI0016818BF7|nr:DMT family transporter [Pseudoalteromonas sp. S16_S37]MBD1583884.1 DMT family transporter [Pseudoalteromonas sp. S16_S37]
MTFTILAFFAGAAIALQASMNAQLGSLLKNPILATVCAFSFSAFFSLLALSASNNSAPSAKLVANVPWYLWGVGGILSTAGVGLCYFLIPKMGVGNLMSFVLSGQLLMAMLISHYGWFSVPQASISLQKLIGIIAMIIGLILVNKDFSAS